MAEFDPYHKWFGIPRAEQPANHYRLLGVGDFETDPDVIESAADQRMTYLRSIADGPHIEIAQRLLNEIAHARIELLNDEKRAAYDRSLHAAIKRDQPRSAPDTGSGDRKAPTPLLKTSSAKVSKAYARKRKSAVRQQFIIGVVGAMVLGGIYMFFISGAETPEREDVAAKSRTPEVTGKTSRKTARPKVSKKSSNGARSAVVLETKTGSPTSPKPAVEVGPDSKPPAGTIDLLAKIDLQRDIVNGRWTMDDSGLAMSKGSQNRLQLDHGVPENYVLSADIVGDSGVVFGLLLAGRQAALVIDGGSPPLKSWVEEVHFVPSQNETLTTGDFLEAESVNHVECVVRSDRLEVFVNDKLVLKWDIVPSKVRLNPSWRTPRDDRLFVGSHRYSYRIKRLELRPLEEGTAEKPQFPSVVGPTTPIPTPNPIQPNPIQPIDTSLKPVPSAEDIAEAQQRIRSIFKSDLDSAKTPLQRIAVAKRLYDKAISVRDSDVDRFVLFSEARDLAIETGALTDALNTVDIMAREFEIDIFARKHEVLKVAIRVIKLPAEVAKLARTCLGLVDAAVAADQYDAAELFVGIASQAGSRLKSAPLRNTTRSLRQTIENGKVAWTAYLGAKSVLETQPDDAAANEHAGKFLCFVKHDWNAGRLFLSKSEQADLRAAAALDSSEPFGADAHVEVADAWRTAATSQSDADKLGCLLRARDWLKKAQPLASGLKQAEIETAIKSVDKEALGSECYYLVDMPEFDVIVLDRWGFGKGSKDSKSETAPIEVNGIHYKRGLGVHPARKNEFGRVRYRLDGKFRTFDAGCAIVSERCSFPMQFLVVGDGRVLWASQPTKETHKIQNCRVSVSGVRVLELQTKSLSSSSFGGHTCWLDPLLLKSVPPEGVKLR